ncbi:MAG TPA: AraC family transcriptional regulator [Mobilitalea sp.]|nr:AraC family transcriptional regulator [Mobilitalea sp.]
MYFDTFPQYIRIIIPGIFLLLVLGSSLSSALLLRKCKHNNALIKNLSKEQEKLQGEADWYKLLYQRQLIQNRLTNFDDRTLLNEIYQLQMESAAKPLEFVCILFHNTTPDIDHTHKLEMNDLDIICQKYFSNYIIKDFFKLTADDAAVLLSADVIDEQVLFDQCKSILGEAAPEDNYDICCVIGKSVPADAFIHTTYRSAYETLSDILPNNHTDIILYSEAYEEAEVISYPLQLEMDLMREIKKNQIDRCEAFIQGYFEELQASSYSNLLDAFHQLVIMVRRIEAHWKLDAMPFSYHNPSNTKLSVDMMKSVLIQQITNDLNELNGIEPNDENNRKLVQKITELVDENAGNPNLNVDFISDKLDLSKNYLRKIFKNVTNINLSVYLQQAKVKKACYLLAETNATVQEITGQLDFITNGYFFRFFKKHTGMTPIQYRLINRNQKANSMK